MIFVFLGSLLMRLKNKGECVMKKFTKTLLFTSLSLLVLAACNKEEVTNAPEQAPTDQSDSNTSTVPSELSTNAPFTFTDFSLDVDYGVTQSVEIDYENEISGVEASYKNDITGEKLKGNEAFTKLEPMFKSLTFDVTTTNEEVISQVLQVFGLANDYTEFDLEVRFADGVEKEYKVKK